MNNFVQWAPTEVVFGKDTETQAGEEVVRWGGHRVLLVYGGGSAVRSGLIDRVEQSLAAAGLPYLAVGGVKANPTLAFAKEAVQQALAFGADFILGVGGGSVIDTAKGIAHGVANPDADIWDFWTHKQELTKSTPVGVVLTIAAAGSEMSDSAVLTNEDIPKKSGFNTPFNRCKFAIMNPVLTFTLPKYQIACGVADIMMHTMERYFIPGITCDLTDEIAEGLLRAVTKNGAIALQDSTNYDAMAEIMWCSSISHNNLTECGRGKDFSVHKIGMALSAQYDSTHGATLSATWGSWARYLCDGALGRFAQYARRVWGVQEADDQAAAEQGIRATESYFASLGLPISLPELMGRKLSEEEIHTLALDATMQDTVKLTRIRPIGAKEVEEIYRMANR